MSSVDTKESHIGRTLGIVAVLVLVYFLAPPVVISLLARAYGGGVHDIPIKVRTIAGVMFTPADWLCKHSEMYQAVIEHEFRLLGNP